MRVIKGVIWVPDSIEEGREFLKQHGIHNLSNIIAAAIVQAEESGLQVKEKLFRIIIHDVCRTALRAGIDPIELTKAATMILEVSHRELVKMREEAERRKRELELSKAEEWNSQHGI